MYQLKSKGQKEKKGNKDRHSPTAPALQRQ
jgi:hypothetical protein